MAPSLRRQLAVATAAIALVLVACNAIVGVSGVTELVDAGPKKTFDGAPGDDDGDDDNDDGGRPQTSERSTLALGYNHGCIRDPDGVVKCWGDNGAGQLGDGIPFDDVKREAGALVPRPVPGVDDAIAIAAGIAGTCVVRKSGAAACWGINTFGQLGDGTVNRSSSPVAVANLTDAVDIAGGQSFMCALHKDKTVGCWGFNAKGQIGDGTKGEDRHTITPVKNVTGAIAIAAATDHACAVIETGDVMCWGSNASGQLGIDGIAESLVPIKVPGLSNVVQIAAATAFACARQKTGRVLCWGANESGQLGNGTQSTSPTPVPAVVPNLDDASFVWTGFQHACATRRGGTVACWGRAGEGQIGTGVVVPADAAVTSPTPVVGTSASIAVWTGGNRSCAVTENGRAFCWGQNTLGQLGNGTTAQAYAAVRVSNIP